MVQITSIRIPSEGREKYPSKNGGTAVSKRTINNHLNNAGLMTSSGDIDTGGDTSAENRGGNAKSFNIWLSKTSGVYSYAEIAQYPITDTTVLKGFKNMNSAQVWVGDTANSAATGSYDIQGIPSGMSISVTGNGTTAATIQITINDAITQDAGELTIPVSININDNNIEPYHYMWYVNPDKVVTTELSFSWTVNREEGTPGAVVRGPYDYYTYSATTRWWCNGEESEDYADSGKWLDVILKDDTYYYCNTTYHGTLAPWESVSSAWTAGESFDFVATNLLLANNAKINFLTNNALYLNDSNNVVTAGARGGNNVNFWAGAENPVNAPFRVMNDGTLYATKGYFAGFIQYPYISTSALSISNGYYIASSDNPYLVSIPYWHDSGVVQTLSATNTTTSVGYTKVTGTRMKLPTPSEELNGYTFRLLVAPNGGTEGDCAIILRPSASNNRDIMNLIGAYDTPTHITAEYGYALKGGCFTITCAPCYQYGGFRWSWYITDGNPNFLYRINSSQPW